MSLGGFLASNLVLASYAEETHLRAGLLKLLFEIQLSSTE
jgi:hypothetical protein